MVMTNIKKAVVLSSVLALAAFAVHSESKSISYDRQKAKASYKRPASVPFPKENAFSPERAELGKMLFFDPRLCGANSIACASCHNPAFSWGDGLAKGVGFG